MPITRERLTYPDFDADRFNSDEPVEIGPVRRLGFLELRRLSPFNVPENVELYAAHGVDALTASFQYPNDEPGEKTERLVGDAYYSCRVLLGKHTRKILRFVIGAHASELLLNQTELLPPSAAEQWLNGLPETAHFACIRNCQVVSAILRELPLDVRRQIVNVIVHNNPLAVE